MLPQEYAGVFAGEGWRSASLPRFPVRERTEGMERDRGCGGIAPSRAGRTQSLSEQRGTRAGRRRIVSFPLLHLWRDVHAALRTRGHPVIRIIGPQGYRQDEDHPQGGLARGCRHLPVLVLVLAFSLFFSFSGSPFQT